MLAIVHSAAVIGLDAHIVEVQVDFNPKAGLPSFTIVGLPDTAVKESRERVRSAIKNTGYSHSRRMRRTPSPGIDLSGTSSQSQSPVEQDESYVGLRFPNKGYVVNLSPADLPKHGPAYDLAIAIGVLASTDQVPFEALDAALFIGELSLDGRIRHVNGVMPMVYAAQQAGYKVIYVPSDTAAQAALVEGITVIPVETLGQLVEHLYGLHQIEPFRPEPFILDGSPALDGLTDFADVKGQELVKRALEIAAAGHHNVRMVGSPGVGKSLLAKAMPGILPSMTIEEALEVTRIYSVADRLGEGQALVRLRPFQNPHHTISQAGLVGGGSIPRPGAVSLSHLGVLFLDECTEFSVKALEVLRQPIEDKVVTISRAQGSVTFPANFLLIIAHNPCPCGYYGDPTRPCSCTPTLIQRYQSKLSGPLLDRIDIHIEVPRVEYDKLLNSGQGESSQTIRERVENARGRQKQRFQEYPHIFANGDMGAKEVTLHCKLHPDAKQLLDLSVRRMHLSARSYHRVLKLSRTIADLGDSADIQVNHVAEALQYRPARLEH